MCIHTSAEPHSAGTTRPICLELLGSSGSTGPIRLDAAAAAAGSSGPCFAPGSSDVFQLEAPAVGELRQLNVWVDAEGAGAQRGEVWFLHVAAHTGQQGHGRWRQDSAATERASARADLPAALNTAVPSEAAWHLDTVEVACKAGGPTARPAYFVCRRWLDERCGYRAELAASARNPRQEEVDYKVGGTCACMDEL